MPERRVQDAEQEEVDQARDDRLTALALDRVHDLVVGGRVELDQDLAHHADTRLAAEVHARERVEVADDLRVDLFGLAQRKPALVLFHPVHPLAEQLVRAAGLGLVRAHAVQAHHQQIAHEQRRNGGLEHLRRNREAGIALARVVEREADDRYLVQAGVVQALSDEADVVGCAAPAAGLGDDEGGLVHVVAPGRRRLHDLARDQDGRVADVVVDVLQARIDRARVNGRQKLEVVAVVVEDRHEQLEVDRRHLGREDGVLTRFLHFLRVLDTRELGRRRHTVGLKLEGRVALARLARGVQDLAACGVFALRRAVRLLLERCQKRADADARRAQVGDLVDLEHGVDLARPLDNLLYLVGGQRVQAAPEGVQLHEVEVGALRDDLCRIVEAGVEHPLVVYAQVALQVTQVRDGILGEHGHAKARDELGDGVVDLVVDVVGAPRQDDAVGVVLLDPLEGLLALRAHLVLEVEVRLPRAVDGVVDFFLRWVRELGVLLFALFDQVLKQTLLERLFVIVGDERVEEVRAARAQLVDVELERLGIAHDDRAVVVVVRARVFLTLPADARHPDEVDVALEKVHDVPVRKFGRIARVFGRHRLDALFESRLR